MNQIDPNFDWVSARAKCSPDEIFALLKGQIQSDVSKRNGLLSAVELQYDIKFDFVDGRAAFKVSRVRMGEMLEFAIFNPTKMGIKVAYGNGINRPAIETSLTLSNDQECKLKTSDGGELSFWQFRKLALEPILFSPELGGW